ncbi:MAG: thymidine kinase [Flavobacteriales bacterium]|nr:thymidine kinase [Flavobacteriales bacterium]|tara:strand:- start:231 stop:809 length:579 start_codon:yes stop_codon:yes gene_type:complete
MLLDSEIDRKNNNGSIEVICGSMFSGKTEELLRRLNKAKFAKKKIEVYKPILDNRYDENKVVSHNKNHINSRVVANSEEILNLSKEPDIIGIDEVQFFDEEIVKVCDFLANKGIRVILAGLDMDFERKPFGKMPEILAIADHVTKVRAICVSCGHEANYSYRISEIKNTIHLGQRENYQPLCRSCYNIKYKS